MDDRSDHRSASHDLFAHVARGEAEVSQAPAEVHGPTTGSDLPGANPNQRRNPWPTDGRQMTLDIQMTPESQNRRREGGFRT